MDRTLSEIIAFALAAAAIMLFLYYTRSIFYVNRAYRRRFTSTATVCLRKFPYPYKAALAICSDIDRTRTAEQFIKIQRFLNTEELTEMGKGVGLEIGNSFFMWPRSKDVFSYFSNRPVDRLIIKRFIEAGYLDVLHSWGEGCAGRDDAIRAVQELKANDLRLKVWVNHATVSNNLGLSFPNYSLDKGDNKSTPYYHADVTVPYGIKFVWTGATTWLIGQGTTISARTFTGSMDPQVPFRSIVNITKAVLKHLLSTFGMLRSRYDMHSDNDVVAAYVLDDGQRIYQFMRYDNHYNGIGRGALGTTMHYNLSPRVVNRLKACEGYAILYGHFGITGNCKAPICEELQAALRYLADQYRKGDVYVTTTSRLLTYYTTHRYLDWYYEWSHDECIIRINSVKDPVSGTYLPDEDDLQGIAFYVPPGKCGKIFVRERELVKVDRNPADETGRPSVSIPRKPLVFPRIDDLQMNLNQSSEASVVSDKKAEL